MAFIRNLWYVAAWTSELEQGKVIGRTIIGDPVALFRKTDGSPVAIVDRCSHRRERTRTYARVKSIGELLEHHNGVWRCHDQAIGNRRPSKLAIISDRFAIRNQRGKAFCPRDRIMRNPRH